MSNTLENLMWRYATKKYDTTKKLTDEQRHLIMEALRLAPSSFGLQPWKFVHVTNPETREKLKAAAWGQPQITDASDFFVLCSKTVLDDAYVEKYMESIATTRGITTESLAPFEQMVKGSIMARSEFVAEWNARQVYIPLGFALATAAEHHIDTSPMEGFDAKQFDEILGLTEQGLASRVLLAVGFRAEDDDAQHYKKARFGAEDVFIEA